MAKVTFMTKIVGEEKQLYIILWHYRTQFLYAIFHCRISVFIYERSRVEDRMKSERKKAHTEYKNK